MSAGAWGEVVLRPGVPGDAEAGADLQRACWREAYSGHADAGLLEARLADRDRWVEAWRVHLASGPPRVVAEAAEGLVGFAVAGPSRDDDAPVADELYALYTRQSWWGSGVGARLLTAVLPAGRPASCGCWSRTRGPAPSTPGTGSWPTGRSSTTTGSTSTRCGWCDADPARVAPPSDQPVRWCTKHQRQSSPDSPDWMTGWPSSWKWRVACRSGEESQHPTFPQATQTRQVHPLGALRDAVLALARRPRLRRRCVVGEVVAQAAHVASRPATGTHPAVLVAGHDVQHALLHVEHGQHLADDLVRHVALAAHLEHLAALGLEHLQPQAGVGLRGRLVIAVGVAELLPDGEVALLDAAPDGAAHVVRVAVVAGFLEALVEHCHPGLGGLVEEGRAGQRVGRRVGRRHAQPPGDPRQRHALEEERAGHHGEGGQEQHLAVGDLLVREKERRRQRHHAAHPGPPEQDGSASSSLARLGVRTGRTSR